MDELRHYRTDSHSMLCQLFRMEVFNMTFIEALQAMQDGKVCENLCTKTFHKIENGKLRFKTFNCESWLTSTLMVNCCLDSNWQIVEQKQEVYQWRYKSYERSEVWNLEKALLTKADAGKYFAKDTKYEIHAGPFEVSQ